LKVPRPCHQKKDPWAAVAFRETLAVALAALALPVGKPVRLWVADEMRYGLQPITRRMWSLRGERPVCAVRPGYQWGYVYGALEVGGQSGAQFLYCPTVNLPCSQRFLRQVAASDPAATHVVLWDGAGFHPKDQSRGQPAPTDLPVLQPGTQSGRKALGPGQRSPVQ
jgi:hypothetical protein